MPGVDGVLSRFDRGSLWCGEEFRGRIFNVSVSVE